MALSFAGVNLLLDTAEHAEWVNAYHDLNLIQITENEGYAGTDTEHLPLPAQPVEGGVEIGVLRWPIGYSRCGTFYCLVNGTRLEEIELITDDDPYQPLVMSDGSGREITATMRMLPPLTIHNTQSGDASKNLYLLTLVDYRYDYRHNAFAISSQPSTWADLFTTFSTALSETITTDTIDADYQTPSTRWIKYYKPLPTLIDAAANAIQHRVLTALDGTITTADYETARNNAEDQFDDFRIVVGGDITHARIRESVPTAVKVVFGKFVGGILQDDPFTVTVNLADLSIPEYGSETGVANTTKVLFADYMYTGTTANITNCNNLATQLATDWYGWQLCNIDFTAPGIWNWVPTGAEDLIKWTYQNGGKVLTQVTRGPWQQQQCGGYSDSARTFREPLVRVISSSTLGGEYTRRYVVRQVEIVESGTDRNLQDVVIDSGSVEWTDVLEIENRAVSTSAAATPSNGVYTLHTSPDGHYYIDQDESGGADDGVSLLCEVTVTDTGSGHTVKQKTWSAGIIDSTGPITYTQCRSTTGDAYPVGWYVYLDPIPDASGNYWISPAPQYAASTKAGLVSATTQTISGAKTLEKPLVVNSLTDSGDALVVHDNYAASITVWSDAAAWNAPSDRTITLFSSSNYGLVNVIGAVKVAEMTTSTVPDSYLYYSNDYNAGLSLSSTSRLLAYKDPEASGTQRRVYTNVRQEYYLQVADNSSGTGAAWRKFTVEDGHIAGIIAVPSSE
jgi:hypothetical protein